MYSTPMCSQRPNWSEILDRTTVTSDIKIPYQPVQLFYDMIARSCRGRTVYKPCADFKYIANSHLLGRVDWRPRTLTFCILTL